MDIVVRPHILSNRNRRVEDIDYGMTIQEMVDSIPDLDDRVRQTSLAVLIDGMTVPREFWNERRIRKEDRKIEVMAVLSGGGGNSKQILSLVATVFLMAFAPQAAGALVAEGGLMAGSSYLMVKAGIVLVGTLAINAIFKPPRANNNGDDVSPTYSFSNQTNQARAYGRLPRIYGRHRYVADVAAVPYTVNAGDDQYLYVIYSFGYGPLDLEDFKIGTNPIGNYADVDMVVHENFTDPTQLKLYRSDVWQDAYNFDLAKNTPVTVTTQLDTDRAMVDMAWPSGLGELDSEDGDHIPRTSSTMLEYRAAGSSDPWSLAVIRSVSRGRAVGTETGTLVADDSTTISGYNEDIQNFYIAAGRKTFTVSSWGPDGPPLPGTKIEFGRSSGFVVANHSYIVLTVESATATSLTTTTGLPMSVTAGFGQDIDITYQSPTEAGQGKWDITGYYGSGFSASADLVFPSKGQWEIRITKLDNDEGDSTTKMWKKFVTGLKSLKNTPPINPPVPVTLVELRIRASGQLNGAVERFSAIATSKLRMWDGSAWVVGATRNPAWIYLDVLQGTANQKPLPDSRIDLDKLKEWAVRCDSVDTGFNEPLGTCDIVIDRAYTVWELLQSVAATGRAAPAMRDNLYSVIIDDAARTPVQMFTPRNSWGLQSTRTYVKEPHGLRVKWIDPQNDWAPAEIYVYNTGYTKETATEFEELQSFGMTRPEQVTRWGRYMLAQGKLRQERFTIQTDIENIVCTRGDLVLVAHDVLEVGGEACRIVEVDGANVYLDAPPTIDTSQTASTVGIRIRKSNGTFTGVLHITAYGNDGEFDFVTVAAADVAQLAGVAGDDLLVFGPISSVVGEYVVDYVRPNGELGATIGLEEFAPAVYTAESSGVIPAYTPPGGGRQPSPGVANLSYQLMEYYSGIRPMARIKLKWRPSSEVSYMPESFRVVEVMDDGTEVLLADQTAMEYVTSGMNLLNWGGRTRSFRVRAFYGARGLSGWSQIGVALPVRTALPPAEVDTFTVENLSAERRRYKWGWTNGQPADVQGVQIRYAAGTVALESLDWATMTELVPNVSFIAQAGIELNRPLGAGTYTFLCRSVDRLGNLSLTGFRVVANLTIEAAANDTTPPPTPAGFTATGGFESVTFTVTNPTYTMGRGHSYTQVYGAVYSGTGPLPTFAEAAPFCSFTGERGVAGAPPATQYRFWAKWVSKDGGISTAPAGGTNGVAATTAIDIEATLDALTGQLTEEQLYADLGARIDLIDGPDTLAGSVAARVKAEADARIQAVLDEANARAQAIQAETDARTQALLDEAAARTQAIQDEADARAQALLDEAAARGAAITAEQTARQSADASLASDISTLTAAVDSNAAAISDEATARADGDSANAEKITTLTSQVANRSEGIWSEQWQDANAVDQWIPYGGFQGELSIIDTTDKEAGTPKVLKVGNSSGDDEAWLLHSTLIPFDPEKLYRISFRVRRMAGTGKTYLGWAGVAADGVTLVGVTGLNSYGSQHYHAAIAQTPTVGEWKTYTGYTKGLDPVGGAQLANSAPNPTAPGKMHPNVRYLRVLLVVGDAVQPGEYQIGAIKVDDGQGDLVAANLLAEQVTRAGADSTLSSQIVALTADVNDNSAAITAEQTARADADSAMASDISDLQADTAANTAAIAAEATARADADSAEATARQILAAQVANQANGAIFTEPWQDLATLQNWERFSSGNGELSITGISGDGVVGGKGLQCGNNTGDDMVWMGHKTLIPFNPDKLYRVEVRVARTMGTGLFFAGLIGVKADGVTTVSPSGVLGTAQGHYFVASGKSPTSEWISFVGYVQGHGETSGTTAETRNPNSPAQMHPDVRYIRPMFIANYNSASGQTYLGEMTITDGAGDLNAATILAEQTARADGDSALSQQITALSAEVGDNEAAIVAEQTARADGDSALASDISSLDTRVGNAESAIVTEQTTRANENAALASDITALTTRVDDAEAAIVTEQTARADGDSSLASDITALTTRVDDAEAAIVTEQTARSSGDSANANLITALTSQVANQREGIWSEQWQDTNAVGRWVSYGGFHGELSVIATTESAAGTSKVLKIGNSSGDDEAWLIHPALIPFDPAKLYRIRFRVKRVAGTGKVYLGWAGVAADGVTLVGVTGLNSHGSQHYHAAIAQTPTLGEWVTYTGYTQGLDPVGGAQLANAAPNPTVPGKMHPDVRYLRVLLVAGDAVQPGEYQIGAINVEDGKSDLVAANLLTEQNTRASEDSALASDITALTATVSDNTSAIAAEATARADADSAEATARQLLAVQVANQGNGAIFTETWQDIATLQNWEKFSSGNGELSITGISGAGVVGGKGLQVGNNTGDDMAWMGHKALIPFNPDKLYRMEVRVNRTMGTGLFYAGVIGVKADGVTTIAPTGVTGGSQGHYFAAAAEDLASGWITYVGYLKGYGATTGSANDNWDPESPAKMHPDVRYIRPMFIANYNSASGQMYLGEITVSEGSGDLNAAAIVTEQTARADADTALAQQISTLTTTVNGNTAAIQTEQTARADADTSMASSITTLQSRIAANSNQLYNGGFELGSKGWTLNSLATGGAFSLSGWGPCFFKTNPTDGTGTLTSDFMPAQAGGEYTISGDTRLTFNAGGSGSVYFDILFYDASGTLLLNGTQNPKTSSHFFSYNNVNREVTAVTDTAPAGTTQMRARFVWDGVNVASVGCRQIKLERGPNWTPYSNEVSLQTQAVVVDGLSAQYTVKVDANGYVAGFGLASTPVNGTPTSTFAVRSDKFYIASPSGPGVSPAMPFVVYTTTQTINGASVPPGVYMRSAFIHNAFITSAMIQSLAADKITASSLSAITATIGTLRTAASGARMEIRDNVIKVYDSSNVLRVQLGDLTL